MQSRFNSNRWFLPLLLVLTTATILLTYLVVGAQHASTVRSQNVARAEALKAAIPQLPAVTSIVPAETSGALDYVASARTNLLLKTRNESAPQPVSLIYRLHPTYRIDEVSIRLHESALVSITDRLETTTKELNNLKKLIEYNPEADLPQRFSDDPMIDERLARIHEGFKETALYIKSSTLVHRNQIASALSELNKKTLVLKEDTVVNWSKELLVVQTLILEDIAAQDIQSSDYVDRLKAVVTTYQ